MNTSHTAKSALDKVISKARVHFYKPIQIAEILYVDRTQPGILDLTQLETYRTASRAWRDAISQRLVGNVSTSSARYQDDVFNNNAVPPHLLASLGEANRNHNGIVENYIYQRMKHKWADLLHAYDYLMHSTVEDFALEDFLDLFRRRSGLACSVDKAFEIVVYALFSTLVHALDARITLRLAQPDPAILNDFSGFVEQVLGLNNSQTEVTFTAGVFPAGAANAADRGLDMWTNFGPIVQVKHIQLNADAAQTIAEQMPTTNMIIVCRTAEADLIQSILNQVGVRIRGIITQDNLIHWYNICQERYPQRLGDPLLHDLRAEFEREFPQIGEIDTFLAERNYTKAALAGVWTLNA